MSKSNTVTQAQADKFGISLAELQGLATGKSCPVYGTSQPLHVRKVRSGKLTVFNISEKARGEKISATKNSKKSEKTTSTSTTTVEATAN